MATRPSSRICACLVPAPAGVSLLNLTAPSLRTYRVEEQGGREVVQVEFTQEMEGQFRLDLSYERARSIFHYAFDTGTLEFDHQEEMLPLIKVIGRSFFTEDVNPADTGKLTQSEFCEVYDCNASQRVIIKFDLKEKETG